MPETDGPGGSQTAQDLSGRCLRAKMRPILARLPIDPAVAASFDAGRMARVNTDPVMPAAELMAKA